MAGYYELTGRRYERLMTYQAEDADYLIVGQGSMIVQAQAVVDYLRESRRLKVGVVDVTMFRPFPGDLMGKVLKGKKGVAVLERTDLNLQPEDRAAIRRYLASDRLGAENSASAVNRTGPD